MNTFQEGTTTKTHSELNAPSVLISTHPSDYKGFSDFSHVHVSAVRCTQVTLKSVYVQLRLDITGTDCDIMNLYGKDGRRQQREKKADSYITAGDYCLDVF